MVYAEAPPFREPTPEEDRRTTQSIQDAGVRILFVGLGSPKQDRWMHAHKDRVQAVMLGVGAAFDFLAGAKPQAPSWMQSSGLEWLFRLASEPRRLWRRYLTQNPKFAALAVAQLFSRERHEHGSAAGPGDPIRSRGAMGSVDDPRADVLAIEIAFLLGLGVRRLVAPWFPNGVGPDQYLGVAAGILLLPMVHYQLGLYPGYMLGPVERLRRRMLATMAVFGGLVAWDNLVARGVFSRGVLLSTLLFVLVLTPLAETGARAVPDPPGALGHSAW